MKILLSLGVMFVFIFTNGQSFQESIEISGGIPPSQFNNGLNNLDGFSNDNQLAFSKMMGIIGEFDDIEFNKRSLDGSIYLFETWENKGEIQVESKKYIVSNINFNIKQDKILMKIEGDSTFVFDVASTDRFSINGKQFTSLYSPSENKNKIYEVLFKDKNQSLLKGYFLSYIEASPNPMVNRSRNKIKRGHSYFIYENGKLKPFKMKKSNTLSLVNSDKSKELEKYIKNKGLSYRKEKDMIKIFGHVSQI